MDKYLQMLLLHVKNLDCSIKDTLGMTPLLVAIEMNDCESVKLLLESSAIQKDGSKRIGIMAGSGGTKMVKYRYKQNADPSDYNGNGETCLMLCSICNVDLSIAKLLLCHGADVNATDSRGETALMYAVQRGQEELVRILLSHGADKYIMNRQNDNCIDLAVLLEKKRIENILNNRRGSYATSVEIEIEETKKCKYSIRIKEDFCANMNSCNIFLRYQIRPDTCARLIQ